MAREREEPAKRGSRKGGPRVEKGTRAGRESQRARLLRAVVAVVAEDGYPQAKIGDIAKLAGVSRATFYELFADKEQCFLAAHRELAERMSGEIEAGVAHSAPAFAAQAALIALVDFAEREPLAFDFVTHEAMLAGPAALAERDQLMRRLELTVERGWEQTPPNTEMPDVCAKLILDGAVRILGCVCAAARIAASGSRRISCDGSSTTRSPPAPRAGETRPQSSSRQPSQRAFRIVDSDPVPTQGKTSPRRRGGQEHPT